MPRAGDDFYTSKEAADVLGVARTTFYGYLRKWRRGPKNGPPFTRLGHRTVKFPKKAFRRWAGLED